MRTKNNKKGFSALPTILIISMIIMEVSVVAVILANTFNNTRFGERLSSEAYGAARSGVQDGILRVIRIKDCPTDPNPGCPSSYTFTAGSRQADVSIADEGNGVIVVGSIGRASLRSRKIEATLGVSSSTGEVLIQSLKEVAL